MMSADGGEHDSVFSNGNSDLNLRGGVQSHSIFWAASCSLASRSDAPDAGVLYPSRLDPHGCGASARFPMSLPQALYPRAGCRQQHSVETSTKRDLRSSGSQK